MKVKVKFPLYLSPCYLNLDFPGSIDQVFQLILKSLLNCLPYINLQHYTGFDLSNALWFVTTPFKPCMLRHECVFRFCDVLWTFETWGVSVLCLRRIWLLGVLTWRKAWRTFFLQLVSKCFDRVYKTITG